MKNARISGKGRQSLRIIHVMRIHKMLISYVYVRLDHTLNLIFYGNYFMAIDVKDQSLLVHIISLCQGDLMSISFRKIEPITYNTLFTEPVAA